MLVRNNKIISFLVSDLILKTNSKIFWFILTVVQTVQKQIAFLCYIFVKIYLYDLNDRGFKSWQGQEIFLLSRTCRLVVGPMQPSIQWLQEGLSPGVKQPAHEANTST
jgi:hypothetical protein